MKAIQYHEKFSSLTEAQETFTAYASLDGFLGGRVYQDIWTGYSSFAVQVFFDCDQNLPYGNLYEGSPERVCLIWDNIAKSLGVGNSYSQVAPQCTIESKPTTEQPTEPEAKEVQIEIEPQPRSVELKEEGKNLHVAIFYQEKAKPKKEEWNYRNVVRAIGNHAKDYNEPMAVKYYGAALFLAHLMDTGRLTGTKVYFKIWKLSTRETCNLIVEIHNQMIKNSYIDERGIIEWLSKKARKSPYDIAA